MFGDIIEAIINADTKTVYPAAGVCIYCGANRYTEKQSKLAKEHIISYGLGGQLIYPQACCRSCEQMAGAFEVFCQRKTFGAFRHLLNLPTRKPKERPKLLPLDIEVDGETTTLMIPREIAPVAFAVPRFPMPEMMRKHKATKTNRQSAHPYQIYREELISLIKNKFGAEKVTLKADYINHELFAKMLAKTAHSFAVAELGVDAFQPLLPDAMRKANSPIHYYVGGIRSNPAPESCRHRISLTTETHHERSFLVATLRLFADLGFPVYVCIVGLAKGEADWVFPFIDNEPWMFPEDEMPENATHFAEPV